MLHTFPIPVKPHVAKYLLHHLGEGYKLSQLDAFGRILKLLLASKKTNNFLNAYTKAYTATFGVSVEGNMILQKRLKALNSKEIIDFSGHVEAIIKAEFYGMVANRQSFGLSQYGAIQQFRAKYNFQDEDITHDALKKAWQRYAEDNPAPKVAPKNVSVCPLPLGLSLASTPHRLAA